MTDAAGQLRPIETQLAALRWAKENTGQKTGAVAQCTSEGEAVAALSNMFDVPRSLIEAFLNLQVRDLCSQLEAEILLELAGGDGV